MSDIKRVMPPTLFYACTISMALLTWLRPITVLLEFPFNMLGAVPLLFGLGISIWGSEKFGRVGTTVKTFDEPSTLVTDGLFRFSRNPMYLGFASALLGIWMLLGALSPVLGVLIFVAVTDRWYIPFEERVLLDRFGRAFQDYAARTRRWI